ncbi:MAG: hypothetical protein HQK65_23025, partial [Desulfamplus sp.]|nr:hypothetical protein [Desulfamplus sp.]
MMLWIRLAIMELSRDRRFSLFFILNLSIGLVGFIALNSFNSSLEKHLKDNLKQILTADLMVSSARPLNENENQIIESTLGSDKKESKQITFFSMVSGLKSSKLAHVIAIDDSYPLYGSIISGKRDSRISNPGDLSASREDLSSVPDNPSSAPDDPSSVQSDNRPSALSSFTKTAGLSKAWLTRDLSIALDTDIGKTVRVGDKEFVVDDIVTEPPGASVISIELAPKIYIGLSEVEATGLLKFGSRINFVRYYRFPAGVDVKEKTVALRKEISDLFNGSPTISVYDSQDVNQNLNRLFGYFTGYMGLIAIVALFLAGIGTAYLFRGYLNTKIKEIAILMSLGARRFDAYLLFLLQVIILGIVSTFFAVTLSFFLLPLFPMVLQGLIPQNFHASTDMSSILLAFVPGIFGSIIFCLPVFVRI